MVELTPVGGGQPGGRVTAGDVCNEGHLNLSISV